MYFIENTHITSFGNNKKLYLKTKCINSMTLPILPHNEITITTRSSNHESTITTRSSDHESTITTEADESKNDDLDN